MPRKHWGSLWISFAHFPVEKQNIVGYPMILITLLQRNYTVLSASRKFPMHITRAAKCPLYWSFDRIIKINFFSAKFCSAPTARTKSRIGSKISTPSGVLFSILSYCFELSLR